jgi:hypothetical protein
MGMSYVPTKKNEGRIILGTIQAKKKEQHRKTNYEELMPMNNSRLASNNKKMSIAPSAINRNDLETKMRDSLDGKNLNKFKFY